MLNKEGFNAWADGYDRSTARSAAGKVTFIQSLLPLLREGGEVACLIKPQFEAGREKVVKKAFPAMTFDRLSPCSGILSLRK